jgi:hypothetical protein
MEKAKSRVIAVRSEKRSERGVRDWGLGGFLNC